MKTAVTIIAILAILAIAIWWKLRSRPRVSGSAQARLRSQWDQARSRSDLHRRVLEGDAVLSSLLDELGYKGTTGEKLKKAGTFLPDIHGIWHAHKLRNRIAHEPGVEVDAGKVARAMAAFEGAIDKFCR